MHTHVHTLHIPAHNTHVFTLTQTYIRIRIQILYMHTHTLAPRSITQDMVVLRGSADPLNVNIMITYVSRT